MSNPNSAQAILEAVKDQLSDVLEQLRADIKPRIIKRYLRKRSPTSSYSGPDIYSPSPEDQKLIDANPWAPKDEGGFYDRDKKPIRLWPELNGLRRVINRLERYITIEKGEQK